MSALPLLGARGVSYKAALAHLSGVNYYRINSNRQCFHRWKHKWQCVRTYFQRRAIKLCIVDWLNRHHCIHGSQSSCEMVFRIWNSRKGVIGPWIASQQFVYSITSRTDDTWHHFTLPYFQWSNGTVKVECREPPRVIRSLLWKSKLPLKSWTAALPIVQSSLNNASINRLGNRGPRDVFTELYPRTPNTFVLQVEEGLENVISTIKDWLGSIANIADLQNALKDMRLDLKRLTDK